MNPQQNNAALNKARNIDQQRARKAFEYAEVGNKEYNREYRTVVLKFPMMIKANGLAYSLAFAYSKDKAFQLLYKQIENWLKVEPNKVLVFDPNRTEFIDRLLHLESRELMWATHEVMKLLDWMKRFVKDETPKKEDDEQAQG